jgi:hypothetical protein
MPTPAAQERNRRTQQALRQRRSTDQERISVWLPRKTANALRGLVSDLDSTQSLVIIELVEAARKGHKK